MGLFGPSDEAIDRLTNAVREQTREIRSLRNSIDEFNSHWPPARPGILKLRVTGEKVRVGMADKLQFVIDVPGEPVPTDVVSREATVIVAGGEPQVSEHAGSGDVHLGPFEGEEGASVSVSVVNIDNAATPNRSEPRVAEFVLADTIAPGAPGEISLRVTGETPDASVPADEAPPSGTE